MLYGTSSFRNSAFTLTTIAALTAFASFSAAAQQLADNAQPDVCASITDGAKQAQCRLDVIKKDTEATKKHTHAVERETAAIHAQGAAADASTACMEEVGKRIDSAKKTGPLSPEQKAMFKAQIERCDKG